MDRLSLAIACLLALPLPAPAADHEAVPGDLGAVLARAAPGDTVRLAAGVHPGPITVETPIRLVGAPGAVLEGPGTGSVLTLAADGIVVSDLTVRGSGADLARDETVILIREAADVTVERCRVEARAFGIYLQAGSDHRILDNVISGDVSLAIARRGNGIHLWKTVGNDVRGNRLNGVRDGVYLSFAHDNLIRDNRGTALRYGIHYMYSERNTLTGNRFSGCTGGIALMFSMGEPHRGQRDRRQRAVRHPLPDARALSALRTTASPATGAGSISRTRPVTALSTIGSRATASAPI